MNWFYILAMSAWCAQLESVCNYGWMRVDLASLKYQQLFPSDSGSTKKIWASSPDCILQPWYERGRRDTPIVNQICCSRHRIDCFSSKNIVIICFYNEQLQKRVRICLYNLCIDGLRKIAIGINMLKCLAMTQEWPQLVKKWSFFYGRCTWINREPQLPRLWTALRPRC